MKKQFISILGLVLIISSCKTTVDLVLKTNDKVNHSAIIALKNKNRVTKKELNCGIISAKLNDTMLFKLKKNEFFQVKSSLTSGNAIIYSSPDISLEGKTNPFKYEIELKTTVDLLDDSISLKTLSASLKKMGINIGANPKNIKDAVDNIIGSLVVIIKDSITNNNTILYTIPPNILGVRKMKLEDIKWQNTNEEEKINLSGSTANTVNATIPMIAKFGSTFENENIYNLRWSMKGFGEHLKPEDIDKSPTQMIMKLPFEEIEQIKSLIEKKRAKVYYINQVYLLKNAELYIQEAKNIEKSVNGVASVISDNIVYTFENSEEEHKSYGAQALSFWGNEYSFTFEKGKVFKANQLNIDYKISFSLNNLNKREKFSPDIFK